jgi:hypothetical protein
MAKHGKELSDDTKKDIIKLNENGYRASQVAQSLGIKIRIWSINFGYSPLKTFLYPFSTWTPKITP